MALWQAPDFESYTFTKLDRTNPADREFISDTWSWDKPVTIGDKVRTLLHCITRNNRVELISSTRPTILPTERFSNKSALWEKKEKFVF